MNVRIVDITHDDSLDSIWRAYRFAVTSGVENQQGQPLVSHMGSLGSNPRSTFRTTKTGAGVGQPIYIGQFSDASGLSYLNARYYNSTQGQFLSQDPVFLAAPSQQNIQDPQSLNSYSYSEDNPIAKSDPNGKQWEIPVAAGVVDFALEYGPGIIGGIGGGVNTYIDYRNEANINPNTPAPGIGQYGSNIAFGSATGYLAEESWVAAGFVNAGGSVAQDVENGQSPNLGKAVVSGLTPGIGKYGFRALAGLSPLEQLEAGISDISPVSSVNVGNISTQQFGYMSGGGIFGMGLDRAQSSMFSSNGSSQSSHGSSGGGGSSSALVSLYQSLVSTLTSLVSALSSGKH
jgi:RHS repeat-associated protein